MSTAGWDDLAAALAGFEAELVAQAPDAVSAADARAYVARLLTGALHDGFLAHEDTANGLKRSWARLGGPFLDYRMWQTVVEPGRDYLLTGDLADVERLGVGTYSVTPESVLLMDDYAVIRPAAGGNAFSLAIGPAGALKTAPATRILMLREFLRRSGDQPARLRLTYADGTPLPPPASHHDLAMVAARVGAMTRQFARWSGLMAQHPNQFTTPPAELAAAYNGDAGTHYYPGYYDLADDEVLVIERPAFACATWSVTAYNHWLEPLLPPFTDLGRTDDHRLGLAPEAPATIRLAAKPGAGIDIVTGRSRGAMLHRTLEADVLAVPATRVERR